VVFIGERWVVDGDGQRRFDDPDDCVCWEIESARERKIPVLPVLAGISSMPSEAVLPASVRFICRQQAAEIQGGRHFFADLERLEGGIARLLGYYEKPIVIGQFGVGAPDHVVVLGTLGDRFQKVPERRSVQKTMLVQAAAGGDAILSWSTQGNVEDWRTDPFGAIGLLRDLTSAPSSVGDFEDSRRTMMHACEHVSRPTA